MQALEDTGGGHSSVGDNVSHTNQRPIIPNKGKELLAKLDQIGSFWHSESIPNSRTVRHNRQRVNTKTESNRLDHLTRKSVGRKPQNTMYSPMGKGLNIIFQRRFGKLKYIWSDSGPMLIVPYDRRSRRGFPWNNFVNTARKLFNGGSKG